MTKSKHMRAPYFVWTPELVATLTARYPHEKTEHIAASLGVSPEKVYRKASRMELKKTAAYLASPDACRLLRGDGIGAGYRFPKGHIPANKGVKGISYPGTEATQFKPGHKNKTEAPIGAHRISKDGALERKITTGKRGAQRWKAVHRIVWEEAFGPIPKGHVVAFKPGMKTAELSEITPERLMLISMADNMRRNSIHNLPGELKKVIQLNGAIKRRISNHERRKRA